MHYIKMVGFRKHQTELQVKMNVLHPLVSSGEGFPANFKLQPQHKNIPVEV